MNINSYIEKVKQDPENIIDIPEKYRTIYILE